MLKESLANAVSHLARSLIWPVSGGKPIPTVQGLRAAKLAVSLAPANAIRLRDLGIAYAVLGQFEEAITTYQKVIDLDPKGAVAWNDLGVAYTFQERHEEAIIAYQKAIDLDPKDNKAWRNLCIAYAVQERDEEAIIAYQKAIYLDPKDDEAWRNLGIVYAVQERYEKAITAYQRAIYLDPKNIGAWDQLGRVHIVLGQLTDAIAKFEKVIELDRPYALAAFVNLGVIKWVELDQTMARQHFVDALATLGINRKAVTPPGIIQNYRAIALLGLGRDEEAIETLTAGMQVMRSWEVRRIQLSLYDLLESTPVSKDNLHTMRSMVVDAMKRIQPDFNP